MDIAEIALAIAMPVAMILAIFGARYKRKRSPVPPSIGRGWDGSLHECRFDTMLADHAGWRCGICGEPRDE